MCERARRVQPSSVASGVLFPRSPSAGTALYRRHLATQPDFHDDGGEAAAMVVTFRPAPPASAAPSWRSVQPSPVHKCRGRRAVRRCGAPLRPSRRHIKSVDALLLVYFVLLAAARPSRPRRGRGSTAQPDLPLSSCCLPLLRLLPLLPSPALVSARVPSCPSPGGVSKYPRCGSRGRSIHPLTAAAVLAAQGHGDVLVVAYAAIARE